MELLSHGIPPAGLQWGLCPGLVPGKGGERD